MTHQTTNAAQDAEKSTKQIILAAVIVVVLVAVLPTALTIYAFAIGWFGIDLGAGAAYPFGHNIVVARRALHAAQLIQWVSLCGLVALSIFGRLRMWARLFFPLVGLVVSLGTFIAQALLSHNLR